MSSSFFDSRSFPICFCHVSVISRDPCHLISPLFRFRRVTMRTASTGCGWRVRAWGAGPSSSRTRRCWSSPGSSSPFPSPPTRRSTTAARTLGKSNFCSFSWIRSFFDPQARDKFFPDLGSRMSDSGSRIPNPYLWGLRTIFWVKNNLSLCQLAQVFYVPFMAAKQGRITFFSPPLFCCCWIRDPGLKKIRTTMHNPSKC